MGLFILRRNRWRAFILLGELVVCVTLACLDEYRDTQTLPFKKRCKTFQRRWLLAQV
jgi:hypothetical protein